MRLVLVLIASVLVFGSPALAGWDEGVAAFKAGQFEQAAHEFQQVVNQSPDAASGHYMLGLTLERLKRKEESLNHLRKAYDLNPNDLATKMALGRSYTSLRRYGDAAKLLGSVDPAALPAKQKTVFYQMRGQARYQTGNNNGAVKDFAQLAKLKPQDAETQYLYGSSALAAGRMDEALSAMGKAVQLAPKDTEKKRTYINALIKKGRLSRDKAAKRSSYEKAASVAKQLVGVQSTYDNLMLQTSAELGAGQYGAAAQTGQTAIAKKATDWLAHYYVGQALSSTEQYTEAVPHLQQALKLAKTPDDTKSVWTQLGFVYEKQKNYTESIDAYTKAGDQAGVARVSKNQETDQYNKKVEEENARIAAAKKEAEALEAKLKELEGGGGTR